MMVSSSSCSVTEAEAELMEIKVNKHLKTIKNCTRYILYCHNRPSASSQSMFWSIYDIWPYSNIACHCKCRKD